MGSLDSSVRLSCWVWVLILSSIMVTIATGTEEAEHRRERREKRLNKTTEGNDRCLALGGICQIPSRRCKVGEFKDFPCGLGGKKLCCVPYNATEDGTIAVVEGQQGSRRDDSLCTDRDGECCDIDESCCTGGSLVKGLCPGGRRRQCCVDADLFAECVLVPTPPVTLYEVEVYFVNTHTTHAVLYWNGFDGGEVPYGIINPAGQYLVYTFPEYKFVARDMLTGALLLIEGSCQYTVTYYSPRAAVITDSDT